MDAEKRFVRYLTYECGLRPKSVRTYRMCLRMLQNFVGKPISDVTAADLRRYMAEGDASAKSKSLILTVAKRYHRFECLETGEPMNGIMALSSPRVYRDPKPALLPEEARALLSAAVEPAAIQPATVRLVYLGLYGGTRISESLCIDDESWRGGRLSFLGKGGKRRQVPVHPDLEQVRDIILSAEPTLSALEYAQKRLELRTGVWFRSHTLRRTFAATLYELDVPREVIGALLGHTDTITGLYAPVTLRKKAQAIAQLTYSEEITV